MHPQKIIRSVESMQKLKTQVFRKQEGVTDEQ